jgi:hypothetical protein
MALCRMVRAAMKIAIQIGCLNNDNVKNILYCFLSTIFSLLWIHFEWKYARLPRGNCKRLWYIDIAASASHTTNGVFFINRYLLFSALLCKYGRVKSLRTSYVYLVAKKEKFVASLANERPTVHGSRNSRKSTTFNISSLEYRFLFHWLVWIRYDLSYNNSLQELSRTMVNVCAHSSELWPFLPFCARTVHIFKSAGTNGSKNAESHWIPEGKKWIFDFSWNKKSKKFIIIFRKRKHK